MVRFSLILLILFANSVSAQTLLQSSGIVEFLDNPQLASVIPTACVGQEQPATWQDPNQCALALCGAPEIYPGARWADEAYEALSQDPDMLRIRGELRQAMERQIAANRLALQEATVALPSMDSMSDEEWNGLAEQFFSNYLQFGVDMGLPMRERVLDIRATPPENSTPAFLNGLAEYIQNIRQESQIHPAKWSYYFAATAEEQEALLASESPGGPGSLCGQACRSYLRNRDLVGEMRAAVDDPALIEENLNRCLPQFAAVKKEDQQLEAFRAQIPNLIDHFVGSSMNCFTEDTKNRFRTHTREALEIRLTRAFTSGGSSHPMTVLADTQSRGPSPIAISTGRHWLGYLDASNRMNPLANFAPCFQPSLTAGSDSVQAVDEMELSTHTWMNPSTGRGIFFHELAHVLSFFVHQQRISDSERSCYTDIRSCAAKIHPEHPATDILLLYHPGDGAITEEDTADIIAARATEALNEPLFSCFLVNSQSNGGVFNARYSQLNVFASHTGEIVRLIREANGRSTPLPSSCQRIIRSDPERFNRCE